MICSIYGHLENLLAASEVAEIIVAGVKSNELVKSQKNRESYISEDERVGILRHFKCVDNVYKFYTRDPEIANEWIKEREGNPIDVIVVGEDLKGDKAYGNYSIIYTERPPEVAKIRSTSSYTKKLKDKPKTKTGCIYKGKDLCTYVPKNNNINSNSKEENNKDKFEEEIAL